ncbi:MAG: hypothetical protein AYK18_13205 [Theionarchaea archaeon DG-70]|nr:MAG: hypothetical protein AYK18_13205 [Theionarchaea archaeon DG-70]
MKCTHMKGIIGFSTLVILLILLNADNECSQQGTSVLFDEYHANWNPSTQIYQIIYDLESREYIIDFSDDRINPSLLSQYNIFVLMEPSKDFSDYEKESIRSFVENGGGLIILGDCDRVMSSEGILAPINDISSMFGIEFNNDRVIDSEKQISGTETTSWNPEGFVIVSNLIHHPVTRGVNDIGYCWGCSLELQPPAVGLAFGNPTSIAGTGILLQDLTGKEKKGEDIVVLAAAEYGMGKVLAIGDTDFLVAGHDRFGDHDGFLSFRHNRQLGLNMFDWVGEESKTPADYDGDGVPDSSDHCINPGCKIVDSRGCPKDSDNDGLDDCEDRCPTEPGTPATNGCPAGDRDNDGIPDDQDACNNPDCSIVDSQGCPKDTDGDGMNDCEDACPSEYGERQNNGCPAGTGEKDSDNDGVPDDQDGCFNPECSIVDSQGCPRDSDNDGVNDCKDQCPNQPGMQASNGCPGQSGPTFCLGTVLLSIMIISGAIITRIKLK